MRLINTSTQVFEEFVGNDVPNYAILSHTWDEDEVTFHDMTSTDRDTKKGNEKIQKTCQIARNAGLEYAWVDTCCIDKSSSAELTEAINSMFHWYQQAVFCIVYLADLPSSGSLEEFLPECRWFTRGWTLQELIAPSDVRFYDMSWAFRGTKIAYLDMLERVTGIDGDVLQQSKSTTQVPVARKMSWAARRRTTRTEDMAYCLLGIFNVNMALLYGEGDRAFWRLQEEIIKTTPDLTIFSWKRRFEHLHDYDPVDRTYCGVLARSPRDFADCGWFTFISTSSEAEFVLTNQGIKIHVPMILERLCGAQGQRYVFPVCVTVLGRTLGIKLRKYGPSQFVREDPCNLVPVDPHRRESVSRTVHFLTQGFWLDRPSQDVINNFQFYWRRRHALKIRVPPEMRISNVQPWSRWDDEDRVFFLPEGSACDYGMANLRGQASMFVEGRAVKLPFECTFYALGWVKRDSGLQCSVINSRRFHNAVDRIRSQGIENELTTSQMRHLLEDDEIPRTDATFIHFPKLNVNILVSFTVRLIRDDCTYLNGFWEVDLRWQFCTAEQSPPIRQQSW